jgi:hypothetical protein
VELYHLDPEFYPSSTRETLPLEVLLELGVLPLGFKQGRHLFRPCKRLNVGVIDTRREAVRRAKRALRERLRSSEYRSIKLYQVEREAFVRVLGTVYGVSEEKLKRFLE